MKKALFLLWMVALLALWDVCPFLPEANFTMRPRPLLAQDVIVVKHKVASFTPVYQTAGGCSAGGTSCTVSLNVSAGWFAVGLVNSSSTPTNTLSLTDASSDTFTGNPGGSYLDTGVLIFNATPTNGGSGFIAGDVGQVLTLACGANVAISTVAGGAVTAIATSPSTARGTSCTVGTGKTTTCAGCNGGGGNSTATVKVNQVGYIGEMFYGSATSASPQVFTCHVTTTNGDFVCVVALYSGTPTAGWDSSAGSAGAQNFNTKSLVSGTTATTSAASELGVSLFSANGYFHVFSSSGNWTFRSSENDGGAMMLALLDDVLSSTGTQQATAANNNFSSGFGLVATIK